MAILWHVNFTFIYAACDKSVVVTAERMVSPFKEHGRAWSVRYGLQKWQMSVLTNNCIVYSSYSLQKWQMSIFG